MLRFNERISEKTTTQPKTIRIKQSGNIKTMLEIVNKARADLHFGMDGNSELYTLTKTDGMVRKFSMTSK